MKDFKKTVEKYDFIVVGGGMTGICAALAAARYGIKTALVHDRPVFGGNASSEIRMHIYGASASGKKPWLQEGGIVHELILANKKINDGFNYSIWDAVLFDTVKKQKNLTVFLNTTMHSAQAADGKVIEIECYQLTTERHIILSADIFADCTGNGTLCAFVGAHFRTGSESKAELGEPHAPEKANNYRMGNTLLFKAVNTGHPVKFVPPVNAMKFTEEQLKFRRHTAVQKELLEKASENEMIMLFDGFTQDYGYWWIELCGDKEDIISEYEEIRDQLVRAVYGVWDHIKNGGDHGAENYDLVWVGMLPGTRESRRIECDYMLNERDIMSNRRFYDVVAYGGWDVDNHVSGGLFAYDKIPSEVFPFKGSYDIPYRSYLVKDFDNLYVGGRCMGASKLAMASVRVMGTCAAGGQAIGTAAAIALKDGVSVRNINIKELQQRLLKDDCYLPNIKNTDEKDIVLKSVITASSEREGYHVSNLLSGVTREIDGNTNQWRSVGVKDEWLNITFDGEKTVNEIRITFDSNFNLNKNITLSARRQRQQETGAPKELVKDFTVKLVKDGATVAEKTVSENAQRLFIAEFASVRCDSVRIEFFATNGINEIRVFEVRVY
ncbi:MAG: FAD-dependent oxidoreductase [Clostridia bacterium]|nr:FAD-dependent oxidoreductase [Clostridia bacterium]